MFKVTHSAPSTGTNLVWGFSFVLTVGATDTETEDGVIQDGQAEVELIKNKIKKIVQLILKSIKL